MSAEMYTENKFIFPIFNMCTCAQKCKDSYIFIEYMHVQIHISEPTAAWRMLRCVLSGAYYMCKYNFMTPVQVPYYCGVTVQGSLF